MYFWNSYPFVRFSIAWITGILAFDYLPHLWKSPYLVLSVLVALVCIVAVISSKSGYYKLRHINGFLALLTLLFMGGLFTKISYHSDQDAHYRFIDDYIEGFSGVIVSTSADRTNYHRYDLALKHLVGDSAQSIEGVIHLYVRKDSSYTSLLTYGDHIVVKGGFYAISGPENPSAFNYKQYLARQGIYAHSFVAASAIKVIRNDPPRAVFHFAYHLREKANDIIDQNVKADRENAISKALLLGIKDHLDNDVKKSYSAAGAMHVLAVSGLHVGIIYLILQLILGKLKDKGKYGKYLFGLLSVVIIWFYAIITGFSPSVMRAATMFSLMSVSQMTVREGNIYNTLGFAAFALLLYDPYLIYSVGFQLSFIAVFGIVYLQPKFYQLINSRYWLVDKAWAITCVSIAAQIATFPLSAYYFHQFPTYFLLANLVVIPGAFLMLVIGVAMLILDPIIPFLGTLLGELLFHLMWSINEVIAWVEKLPWSLVDWIYMDQLGLICTYFVGITLLSALFFKSFKTLVVCAVMILAFIGFTLKSHSQQSREAKLIFYGVKNKTAIDLIRGHHAKLFVDDYTDEELQLLSFQINPNRLASHLPPIQKSIIALEESLETDGSLVYGSIGDKRLIIFDSSTFHLNFKRNIETDILLINNQAVKSLDWLSQHFTFQTLIIGNKNPTYYSRKMKAQANELGINIHSLVEDGALIINL